MVGLESLRSSGRRGLICGARIRVPDGRSRVFKIILSPEADMWGENKSFCWSVKILEGYLVGGG